jgi:hypothetical protein
MLHVWNANVKEGRDTELKNWYKKNKPLLQKHVPEGWKFVGMYGATMGLGPHDLTMIYEFEKFSDMDKMRDFNDPVDERLTSELMDFLLPGSSQANVLREADDWRTTEPRKPEK